MILLYLLLLLLPHCAHRISMKKPFKEVQEQSKDRIDLVPGWHYEDIVLEKHLVGGVTIQDAIRIGVNNNNGLQREFEELGISKADLMQAGFYSNPNIQTVFLIPKKSSENQTQIDFSATFAISDLWQVPLRKQVAQDALEVKTFEVLNAVLFLRRKIQAGYTDCLYHKAKLELTQEITDAIKEMRDRIYYRYQFGYVTDLDKHIADSKVGEWEAKLIEQQAMLSQSYVLLHQLMGIEVDRHPIKFLDSLTIENQPIDIVLVQNYALEHRPEILVAQMKIIKADHTISYERSLALDNVQLGIGYERDFEKGTSGVGPAISLDIPIFNVNYGNIEAAKYQKFAAKEDLINHQRITQQHVLQHYTQYEAFQKQIHIYEHEVIPAAQKGIDYSQKYFDSMQLPMPVLIDTQINFYTLKTELLTKIYEARLALYDLEFSAGAQIENIQG